MNYSRNPILNRRSLLKLAALAGGSAGIATLLSPRIGNSAGSNQPQSENIADINEFLQQIRPIEPQNLQLTEYSFETVTVNRQGQIIDRRQGSARSWREPLANGSELEMVAIPGGSFLRGSKNEEKGDHTSSEKPETSVTTTAFFLSKYPITQAQWRAIAQLPKINLELNPDPSFFKGDNLPVEKISWYEAIEFCQRLSQATGKDYRLPSESRWEYACRAGTTTPFYCGETLTSERANYFAVYDPYAEEPTSAYLAKTTPVGSFAPNNFGLYDMHGNVGEWCADSWHRNYQGNPPLDGSAWLDSDPRLHPRYRPARLVRGGSWGDEARHLRSANRTFCFPDKHYSVLGLRVMADSTG
jgi:formylglycine-generating enzyme required for sulfatase activity